MSEKVRFNPYENIETDNQLDGEEFINIQINPRSETFFDRDGHGDAFNAHPLAWESISYRSKNEQ